MTGSARIGLDANPPFVSRAGVARYVEGLLSALPGVMPPDWELLPLAWRQPSLGYAQPARMLKTAYRELWWGQVLAPRELRSQRVDLFHSTGGGQFIRVPAGIRHVATLHDVSVARHPERFRRWQLITWRHRMARLLRADRVICSSTFTADEAMSLLGLAAARIDVVPLGCDWHDGTRTLQERVPSYAVPAEFFLFVGTLEPGKNLALLRRVWVAAASAGTPLPPLLIVGARRLGVTPEGPPPPGWRYLGWQPDEVLLHLYRRAHALVFPSIYEGFGLPVIEAMAVGCPVICSPVASLPEIAGDAAFLTPLDEASYLTRLRELLANSTLRASLIDRGLRNAGRFTWRQCAANTLAVYAAALSRPSPR